MRVLWFMEHLLTVEAEAKYLLAARDRSYEQSLKKELLQILEEAEFLFGPRGSGYELREPLVTDCITACTVIYPFRISRIYIPSTSKRDRRLASYDLAHEAIHVLSPGFGVDVTVLEEGLASYFSLKYMNRVYGVGWESTSDPKYDAAMRAVSTLLSKNEFLIKQLRTHQPVLSKIDEKLLIEVAGIEPADAKFLCSDFQNYWHAEDTWSKSIADGAKLFADGFRSIWDQRAKT
jgi:hypothetical protein